MTKDEIVKALRSCASQMPGCGECPYRFYGIGSICIPQMAHDALELIEGGETNNA